jgi:hypothetical protein
MIPPPDPSTAQTQTHDQIIDLALRYSDGQLSDREFVSQICAVTMPPPSPDLHEVIAEAERLLKDATGGDEWHATDDGRVITDEGFLVVADGEEVVIDTVILDFIAATPRVIRHLLTALKGAS